MYAYSWPAKYELGCSDEAEDGRPALVSGEKAEPDGMVNGGPARRLELRGAFWAGFVVYDAGGDGEPSEPDDEEVDP